MLNWKQITYVLLALPLAILYGLHQLVGCGIVEVEGIYLSQNNCLIQVDCRGADNTLENIELTCCEVVMCTATSERPNEDAGLVRPAHICRQKR